MKIETTINVRIDLLNLLCRAASLTGKTKSMIVSMLLIRLSQSHHKHIGSWKRVRYQNRDPRGRNRRLHVRVKDQEYELFLDLRKFCKQSVSRLVAEAIETYLDEMIKSLKKGAWGVFRVHYFQEKVIKDGVLHWILTWGYRRVVGSRNL